MEIDKNQEAKIEKARSWIVERMKSIRHARGLSQAEVAKKLGVHFSRVSDLELGRNDYKISTVLRIALALEVSVDDIFRGCPSLYSKRPTTADRWVVVSVADLETRLKKAGLTAAQVSSLVESLTSV